MLNRYETFHFADGRVLKPDRGEGQQWATKPGNLYSKPAHLHVDPARPTEVAIVLDQEVPPITPKPDTEFVKHVRIRSEMLSKFWGRDRYIGAYVLLPKDFDAHPNGRFPLMLFHGHFPTGISDFRTTPPQWMSADFPRFLVIEIDHANPYYDDSYAVNSANLGPYGDAINHELIPEIERRFRAIGAGWGRFTYGGSTGGWEALATQVFYPDLYNGAFAACPDPVDFRAYTLIDLYHDKNAYRLQGEASAVERPAFRNYLGEVFATQRDENYMELAQGDQSRSGGQYDIWQAVFGPVGKDGYPQPIFDKRSGDIDAAVAAYWREHFDLSYIIARDWATLEPQLKGKIHLYVGSGDNYYFAYSRLHYHYLYMPTILKQISNTAPHGADLTSWRY